MIYILYERTTRNILALSTNKDDIYKKLGKLAYDKKLGKLAYGDEEDLDDIHLIEIDEEKLNLTKIGDKSEKRN